MKDLKILRTIRQCDSDLNLRTKKRVCALVKTQAALTIAIIVIAVVAAAAYYLTLPKPAVTPPKPEVVEAEFQVVSIEVAPTEVVEGKPVVITVKVANTGKAGGVYSLVLKVNKTERFRRDLEISAGATQSATFELVEDISGIYTLEAGGKVATLRVIGAGAFGQNLARLRNSNGKIVSSEPLQIESPYENVEVNRIMYLSDSLKVVGFLVKPKGEGAKYPAIIYNRGGSREFAKIEISTLKYLSFLSAKGYVIVASQYRGNDGGEGREEYGGSDINDVLNLIPMLESLPFVDPNRIAMLGYSRGGMMSYIAITMTDKIKAVAVVGGVTDLIQLYNEREQEMKQVLIDSIGGTPRQKEAEYKKRSAYFWPEKINSPVLILHGEADDRAKVTQAQKLADRLKELGKTYELVIYPHGSHGLHEYSRDRDDRILKWFAKYLGS